MATKTISEAVHHAVEDYFVHMEDEEISDLYELVMKEVEAPLLACTLQHTANNQSRAAAMLGMSRGTLRTKLRKYRLL